MEQYFLTGELYKYLGFSRDKLRYYEEKGLIKPKKDDANDYRHYDIMDVYKLMVIDFYQKRGMKIKQLQDILSKSDFVDMYKIMGEKKIALKKTIKEANEMLIRIDKTEKFMSELEKNVDVFSIKPLPKYEMLGEISDFIAVEEYSNVKPIFEKTSSDMLSQIVRYINFDSQKVLDSKMYIVSELNGENRLDIDCLYTVVKEIHGIEVKEDLMTKMHSMSKKYAKENMLKLNGEAYAMIRLITYEEKITTSYIEIYILLEKDS